jgi:hypothetical protein
MAGAYDVVASVLRRTATQMTINRLLKDSKLGAEEIARLNAAYSYALRELSLVDRNDPLTEMLARKIIEVSAMETDPAKIAQMAVLYFKH